MNYLGDDLVGHMIASSGGLEVRASTDRWKRKYLCTASSGQQSRELTL